MEDKKLHGCTSVLSLAEILSYPKLQLDRLSWEEERRKFWQTPNLKVVDIDSKICEAASILKVKYSLTLPDAIQVTTAIFSKAEGFVTNDERYRLTVENWMKVDNKVQELFAGHIHFLSSYELDGLLTNTVGAVYTDKGTVDSRFLEVKVNIPDITLSKKELFA